MFGIYERGGKVYTEIVPDVSKSMLQGIIRGKADVHSVINSDGWRGYNRLVDIRHSLTFASIIPRAKARAGTSISTVSKGLGYDQGLAEQNKIGTNKTEQNKTEQIQRLSKINLAPAPQKNQWRYNHKAAHKLKTPITISQGLPLK